MGPKRVADKVALETELALTDQCSAALRHAVEEALDGVSTKTGVTVLVMNVTLNVNAGQGSQIALPGTKISNVIKAEHIAAFGGRITVRG